MSWQNKQVFKVDPSPAKKSGKIMKEKCKTDRYASLFRYQHFSFLLIENPFLQQCFSCYHLIRQSFITCQLPDQSQDQRNILPICIPDCKNLFHNKLPIR